MNSTSECENQVSACFPLSYRICFALLLLILDINTFFDDHEIQEGVISRTYNTQPEEKENATVKQQTGINNEGAEDVIANIY